MSPVQHSIRCGLGRGRREFLNSLRNPGDVGYYVIGTLVFVVVLYLNRATQIEGAGITVALLIFPGVIALVASFSALMGLATVVATEREDGTLLRCKAMPHGLRGYVVGQVTRTGLEALFSLALLLIPAVLIVGELRDTDPLGVLQMMVVLVLGLAGCVSIGLAIGSFFKNPRAVGGWGFLIMGGLIFISGLFAPITTLPSWLQVIGQIFPLYWIGLGLRSGLLPDTAVGIEVGESWRTWETFAALGGWAALGMVLAPVLLRRMARRESGSGVAERRQAAMQRV